MGRASRSLGALARAVEARGLAARRFSFGVLATPRDVDVASWVPVQGAIAIRLPGGDGHPASLEVQGGLFIPPLEAIIKAHDADASASLTWSASFTVERLSIVMSGSRGASFPDTEETGSLAGAMVALAAAAGPTATFDHARDYFTTAIHENPTAYVGLGFHLVVIRYLMFSMRHGLTTPSRTDLLKLVGAAGRDTTQRFERFLAWWDRNPPARRLVES